MSKTDKTTNPVPKKEENKEATQTKLGLFEEEDLFEEFDDEGKTLFINLEWNESHMKEDIDINKWQEDWEDEEINDQFEKVLKKELDTFKLTQNK